MAAAIAVSVGYVFLQGGPCFAASSTVVVDDFDRPDSLYHGDGWESLNPGYWKLQNNALRRRLKNIGDGNATDWFPWHWETHRGKPMPTERDPSLPTGLIWRRDWKLSGNYTIRIEATIRALPPKPEGKPRWRQEQPGYGLMGICFGGQTLFESWHTGGRSGDASWMALWRDNGEFGIYDHATNEPKPVRENAAKAAVNLEPGDRVIIKVSVTGDDPKAATVTATLKSGSTVTSVECSNVDRQKYTDRYFGLAARGLLDFEVNRVMLDPGDNKPIDAPLSECHVCYALGDTLRQVNGQWRCKFIAIFRNDGKRAELRISDTPHPKGGWRSLPIAGAAPIVNNDFRRNTAVIDAVLPINPADKTLYFTIWKDGENVTADPRLGAPGSVGPGTGMVGDVPATGKYIGRLPRLKAPYRLCGLGGHAIHGGGPNLPRAGKFQEYWVHDQPTPGAYKYLQEYDFQILNWEDDVWYLELLLCPPSTDDAYKIITTTIAGPTTRWQMMRHWNVVNPGDHDYGMDDIKGPEQIIIRLHDDLGQDAEYMRRNFQIVQHLVRGDENPSGTENPRNWRRWKMPDGDFSLVILDSRLWRTSQDTKIWDDEGWGHKQNLYDRTDPTRTLLGEEQFAWLQQIIRSDSSPLICVTGLNALHTVWTGAKKDPETGLRWNQRDRVAADYAGWAKAGADRVLELLGSREGIVTVYGDVHLASIMRNLDHRVYECSFGPIGRSGSRGVKKGFGPRMTDYDGRPLEIRALYHARYGSPDLKPRTGPKHWNFLEMHFDPRGEDPSFSLKIRNMIDPPTEAPRGSGFVKDHASNTGRPHTCNLPPIKTLPNADVRFSTEDGQPIRGARSLANGVVPICGLVDVAPGTRVVMTSFDGIRAEARVINTLPIE